VGRAVESAIQDLDGFATVTALEPAEHPDLIGRTAAGADLLRGNLTASSREVVINCCGRLRGSDEELLEANSRWPAWLADVLAGRRSRLIQLGSASEYGDPGGPEPLSEDRRPQPSGAYGETKWAGSSAVLDARSSGLDATVVRGFNLVAADVPEVSPLHQFRSDVTALPPDGGEVTLWDPATVRDFILLSDLADVVARLATLPSVPDVVNACSGVGIEFGSIVAALGSETGREITVTSLDKPGVPVVIGDPTKMTEVTGIAPAMDPTLLARTILGRSGR